MKIAQYESNKGHTVIVYDNRDSASLIGCSGRSLSYEYISLDKEILTTVASVEDDTDAGLELLHGASYFDIQWRVLKTK